MDIYTLLEQMRADAHFTTIARNPLAQFGRNARQYLGATLLPERTVPENAYREESIRYRTVIANSGTRYSPVQIKQGVLTGSFLVELAESDIGSEFASKDYDALIRYLNSNQDMSAMTQVMRWADTTLNLPLIELAEKQRWDAIVDAQVTLSGANAYSEVVQYANPSGHRVAQSAAWSTDTTDIFEQIHTMADLLSAKGYTVNRIVTSRTVLAKMAGNNTVKTRTGLAVVSPTANGSVITSAVGRVTRDAINNALVADGLPPIELYDLQYRTQTGTGRFLKNNVFVMIATTGQDEAIDLGDDERVVNDTLGYMAIGRAAGQSAPGRTTHIEAKSNKPPRIDGEAWQTSLPVITEPEAIAVIHSIT